MRGYQYLNEKGSFRLKDPELTSYLYFPIANERGVMSCVTPTLGGDSKMGQNTFLLAPVSNEDLHNSKSTRNFWCYVEGRGAWSATGNSARQQAELFTGQKEDTVLEAGIMWHKVTRTSKQFGMMSEIISFVPCADDMVELMLVTIKNCGENELKITPTAAIPMYGRSADNIRDHRNVTSLLNRVETGKTGVILNPTLTFDERGHQKNTVVYGVFGSAGENEAPAGFYPIQELFIGEGGSFENPFTVIKKQPPIAAGIKVEGYEALGGIQFSELSLASGEEKTYCLVMGYGDDKESLEQCAGKYLSESKCREALESTKGYWEEKVNVSYRTGSKEFDAWMYWVNFQPMLRRIYGCSFLPYHDYGRGGRGWRDLWQDCLALLIMNPRVVRDMLISNFGGVRVDGTNATIIGAKQGEFIADRNNITRVWMDHGAWPFLTTKLYIMQSGDFDILLQKNHYFKDPQASRGEEKDTRWKPEDGNRLKTVKGADYQGTILEHMLLEHLTAFYDVGEHNHIRLRGADWNDALDMAKERGESVAFTALYGSNLKQMADLILELDKRGIKTLSFFKEIQLLLDDGENLYSNIKEKQDVLRNYCTACKYDISGDIVEISCRELAENLNNKSAWIRRHIQETEWITDKDSNSWYNGYYDNHGRAVEGDHDLGVRMMLTSQVFTVMSDTATTEQVKQIIRSADAYLYDETLGGYKLNTNFHEVKTDLGRMFGFAYGHKENGAVFSHMTVMYAYALYQRGFAVEGYKAINSLYRHCSDFTKSRIYPGIPEYIGDNGRGLYPYLTGSASWLLLTVLTEMFGVKGYCGDLLLEPKLMPEQYDEQSRAGVTFIFADRCLEIVYQNNGRKEYGNYQVGSVTIDNVPYQASKSNRISRSDLIALEPEKDHKIFVELI